MLFFLMDDILVFLFLLSESLQDSSSSCCLDIPRQCLPQPIRNTRDKPVLWSGVKQKNMRPTQLQQNPTTSHSQEKRKIAGDSGGSRQQIVNDWKAGENSLISRIQDNQVRDSEIYLVLKKPEGQNGKGREGKGRDRTEQDGKGSNEKVGEAWRGEER